MLPIVDTAAKASAALRLECTTRGPAEEDEEEEDVLAGAITGTSFLQRDSPSTPHTDTTAVVTPMVVSLCILRNDTHVNMYPAPFSRQDPAQCCQQNCVTVLPLGGARACLLGSASSPARGSASEAVLGKGVDKTRSAVSLVVLHVRYGVAVVRRGGDDRDDAARFAASAAPARDRQTASP